MMGIKAIYPKHSLSQKSKCHKVYPYLLKKVEINKPNFAWVQYKKVIVPTSCIKIYTKRMQIEDLKQTPTGSDIPAQGIALGRCQPLKRTLKGCNIYRLHYQMYVTPLQGYLFFVFLSQGDALGWYI